ncbi:GIY-YIG nuclease family protein [Pseudoruegeria sp. HB172150]|uniref:GIY-YIG nuclease family protein n=1 Tax=Pseudoruegeria sp. HB172150 TaxID=2721164 RepID=UPI00155427F7|nr:GIY-YIG nuclease family protein [Pseudoruegeria sp. HB172150]
MVTKEHIIGEIRRVSDKIGRAPGRLLFEKETGIHQADWYGTYWRSWGDAITEAGLAPNRKQVRLSSEDVLRKYAEAVRHFQRVPAEIDIRMYARERPDFPGHTTFTNHFGSKAGIVTALSRWATDQEDFADILELLPETEIPSETPRAKADEGFVYLLKSGDHYKIGRSADIERRVKQVGVAMPEQVTLEHVIRTDDPPGIEAYWHRRFADKRANGEWFRLTPADLRAFKRRKFQ